MGVDRACGGETGCPAARRADPARRAAIGSLHRIRRRDQVPMAGQRRCDQQEIHHAAIAPALGADDHRIAAESRRGEPGHRPGRGQAPVRTVGRWLRRGGLGHADGPLPLSGAGDGSHRRRCRAQRIEAAAGIGPRPGKRRCLWQAPRPGPAGMAPLSRTGKGRLPPRSGQGQGASVFRFPFQRFGPRGSCNHRGPCRIGQWPFCPSVPFPSCRSGRGGGRLYRNVWAEFGDNAANPPTGHRPAARAAPARFPPGAGRGCRPGRRWSGSPPARHRRRPPSGARRPAAAPAPPQRLTPGSRNGREEPPGRADRVAAPGCPAPRRAGAGRPPPGRGPAGAGDRCPPRSPGDRTGSGSAPARPGSLIQEVEGVSGDRRHRFSLPDRRPCGGPVAEPEPGMAARWLQPAGKAYARAGFAGKADRLDEPLPCRRRRNRTDRASPAIGGFDIAPPAARA